MQIVIKKVIDFSNRHLRHFFVCIFTALVFVSMLTKMFKFEEISNVVSVWLVGLLSITVGIVYLILSLARKNNVTTFDTKVFITSVVMLTALFVINPVTSVNIFGFSFQPTTLIAMTSYMTIFLSSYIFERISGNAINSISLSLRIGLLLLLLYNVVLFLFDSSGLFITENQDFSILVLIGVVFIIICDSVCKNISGLFIKIMDMAGLILLAPVLIISKVDALLLVIGLGGFIVALLSFLVINKTEPSFYSKVSKYFVILVTIILFITGIMNIDGIKNNDTDSTYLEQKPTTSETIHTGLTSFSKNPLEYAIGTGPNSFWFVWNNFMPNQAAQSKFWDTDFSSGSSFMLTILIEFGIPFFILLNVGVVLIATSFLYNKIKWSVFHLVLFIALYWMWIFVPSTFFLILMLAFSGALLPQIANQEDSFIGIKASLWIKIATAIMLVVIGSILIHYSNIHGKALYFYHLGYEKIQNSEEVVKDEVLDLLNKSSVYVEKPKVLIALSNVQLSRATKYIKGGENTAVEGYKRKEALQDIKGAISSAESAVNLDKRNYRSLIALAESRLLEDVANGTNNEGEINNNYQDVLVSAQMRILPRYLMIRALATTGYYDKALTNIESLYVKFPDFELSYLTDIENIIYNIQNSDE